MNASSAASASTKSASIGSSAGRPGVVLKSPPTTTAAPARNVPACSATAVTWLAVLAGSVSRCVAQATSDRPCTAVRTQVTVRGSPPAGAGSGALPAYPMSLLRTSTAMP